jgi:hypothetical protein
MLDDIKENTAKRTDDDGGKNNCFILFSRFLLFFFVPFSRALSTGEGVTHRRKRERGELYVMMMGH